MQDFHLVTAQTEVIEKFHWLHNKDKHAKVGVWCPISFADAPDCTKRRTVLYSSPLNIPAWLQNILGGLALYHQQSFCQMKEHACLQSCLDPASL